MYFRFILDGLTTLLNHALKNGRFVYLADNWCYPLVFMHLLAEDCPFYTSPKVKSISSIDIKTSGLYHLEGAIEVLKDGAR